LTNIDVIIHQEDGSLGHRLMLPCSPCNIHEQLNDVLERSGYRVKDLEFIAVSGGQCHLLPAQIHSTPIIRVAEIESIGFGGLYLAGIDRALVVSAGSGTAMVAARDGKMRHVTGSAVGGGTLLGLGKLLLGTADAREIDALAMSGDANAVDVTLFEAVGDRIGNLPPDANAVNFGKIARQDREYTRIDVAAGLVRMVAQVIAVIAINAARAENLSPIIYTGHLVDLPSICCELHTTGSFYQTSFVIPENPGYGTVIGALLVGEKTYEKKIQ
jgi:type II pantothenate kinase